tara:strand:+ start:39 stop:404 length:366 start_codon:yes stop_codon:yes gene_type:complete
MHNQKRRFRPRQQKNNFRRRSNHLPGNNGGHFQSGLSSGNLKRNGSLTNPVSVEKAIQKYQQLAKDALSSGDPILSENYLQHADHFTRRLSELNIKFKEPVLVKSSEKQTVDKSSTIKKDE